jgi:hypothetical protein
MDAKGNPSLISDILLRSLAWLGAVVVALVLVFNVAFLLVVLLVLLFGIDILPNLTNKISNLENNVSNFRSDLEKNIDGIASSIKSQGNVLQNIPSTIGGLSSNISSLSTDIGQLKTHTQDTTEKIVETRKLVDHVKQDIDRLLARLTTPRTGITLVYFVHSGDLRESDYHHIWEELDQGDIKLKCYAQETAVFQQVYPGDKRETLAPEATKQLDAETFKKVINTFRKENGSPARVILVGTIEILDDLKLAADTLGKDVPIFALIGLRREGEQRLVTLSHLDHGIVVWPILNPVDKLKSVVQTLVRNYGQYTPTDAGR